MVHSKCQVKYFYWKMLQHSFWITLLFFVHFRNMVLVKLALHSEARPLTCPLLGTGHFRYGWTGYEWVRPSFATHTELFFLLLIDSQDGNRNRPVEECSVTTSTQLLLNIATQNFQSQIQFKCSTHKVETQQIAWTDGPLSKFYWSHHISVPTTSL
jgi:hypothetical protein